MDKVMIDGIDVSGCEHYRAEIETKMPYGEYEILKDKCHYSGIEIIQNCKGNKGCIYKQLKRLQHYQAEFEHELMNDYTYDGYISPNGFTPIDVIKHIKSELKRLQAEYDDLHLTYAGCKTANTGLQELNQKLQAENEQLKKLKFKSDGIELLQDANLNLHNANVKYRQALQEIREIVSKIIDSYIRPYGDFNQLKTILAKINEVIGAE